MRVRAILILAALCAASLGVAQGQQAAATSSPKGLHGLSFTFDAPSGQLTASGLTANLIQNASTTATTGTIDVTITVNVISRFPRGTTFPCAATAIGGQLDTATATINGGIETANGFAARTSASTVSCTLTIPYEWTLVNGVGDNGLLIAFAVGAVTERGKTLRSSLQLSGIESLPASGATSTFTFHAAL